MVRGYGATGLCQLYCFRPRFLVPRSVLFGARWRPAALVVSATRLLLLPLVLLSISWFPSLFPLQTPTLQGVLSASRICISVWVPRERIDRSLAAFETKDQTSMFVSLVFLLQSLLFRTLLWPHANANATAVPGGGPSSSWCPRFGHLGSCQIFRRRWWGSGSEG
jgi:hypothetical protein